MAQYYFKIESMSPHQRAQPRTTNRGSWIPPKFRGGNTKGSGAVWFSHDGTMTANAQTIALHRVPDSLSLFQTYSLYSSRSILWTVPYDATATQVDDGVDFPNDDDDSSGEDEYLLPDWAEPTFRQISPTYVSYVRPGQELPTLATQRHDQSWAHYFLPDRYQKRPRTRDSRYGGLVGDLALLIGIVAMALPPRRLPELLPRIIANPWRMPDDLESDVSRSSQWLERKGLVINVYYDEDNTTREELQRYQLGQYGLIFN